jgi:hypothetical protein
MWNSIRFQAIKYHSRFSSKIMTASIVCSYLSKHNSWSSKRPQAINFRHAQNLDMVAGSNAPVHTLF